MTSPSPQYFKAADLSALALEPLVKDGRIYVATFANGPLRIQTPAVTVRSVVEGAAWIVPTGPFRDFLRHTEDALKDLARSQAGAWNISEDQVERSFKSFFDAAGAFKVRLHADFAAFGTDGEDLDDVDIQGATARLLLELDRVSVGKTEMGALWRLVQLRLAAPPPPCLIDLDVEVPDDEDLAADGPGNDDDFV
jgi:hypothetical protein